MTQKYVYPLPRVDDLLDQLSVNKVFSTLDARSGYWQMRMHKFSREKMAFVTMDGLFKFCIMPFGLCNMPATSRGSCKEHCLLLGGIEPFSNVYLDDVIIFSLSNHEHVNHLSQVLEHLKKIGYKLHLLKYRFTCPKVLYLGHIILAEGISPHPDHVRAVQKFRNPTNVYAVRKFLSIAGYCLCFIPQRLLNPCTHSQGNTFSLYGPRTVNI